MSSDPGKVKGADYPSETFRVLKEKETRQFGEYRTERLVLEAWKQRRRTQPSDVLPVSVALPPLEDLQMAHGLGRQASSRETVSATLRNTRSGRWIRRTTAHARAS